LRNNIISKIVQTAEKIYFTDNDDKKRLAKTCYGTFMVYCFRYEKQNTVTSERFGEFFLSINLKFEKTCNLNKCF